jgi:putative transposase
MARAARDQDTGMFHVTAHSVWSTTLFFDSLDYAAFAKRLGRTVKQFRWLCRAVVLMPNHYHLLLDVDNDMLAAGMHALNCGYARDFNRRYRLRGHVFAARYDSPRVDSEAYLLRCYRYVVRNPVKAGLCESPLDWEWSSYAGSVGVAKPVFDFVDTSPVIDCFGSRREEAVAALRAFVESD